MVNRLLAGGVLCLSSALAHAGPEPSLRVEAVGKGWAAERAGFQSGDLLLTAESVDGRRRPIRSAFDLRLLELTEGVKRPVAFEVRREGKPLRLTMPPGQWDLFAIPMLDARTRRAWEEGVASLRREGSADEAMSEWRTAADLIPKGRWLQRAGLWIRAGELCGEALRWDCTREAYDIARDILSRHHAQREVAISWSLEMRSYFSQRQTEAAERAAEEAVRAAEATLPESALLADALAVLGRLQTNRVSWERADETLQRALSLSRRVAPSSMLEATALRATGNLALRRRQVERCRAMSDDIRRIYLALAPDSREMAIAVRNLSTLAMEQGNHPIGYALALEAVQRIERLAPESIDMAIALTALGYEAVPEGNLAQAEASCRQAIALLERIAPDSLDLAEVLDNLGIVLHLRGDLDAAERVLQRARRIFRRLSTDQNGFGYLARHLADVAATRRQWGVAEELLRESLEIHPGQRYESLDVALSLSRLALVLLRQGRSTDAQAKSHEAIEMFRSGRLAGYPMGVVLHRHGDLLHDTRDLFGAEKAYCESLDVFTAHDPGNLEMLSVHSDLGDLAMQRGDLDVADYHLKTAVAGLTDVLPGTIDEAEALHRLGRLRRQQRRLREAVDLLRRAIDAIEAQTGRLGGSEEVRADFAATFKKYYRDYVETRLELEEHTEAFRGVERYRARSFLAMLAERDLKFGEDLPADLVQERAVTEAQFSQTQALLSRSNMGLASAEQQSLRARLKELQERREEVKRRVREASPRVSALRYPEPLSAEEMALNLDPEMALLSFMTGERETLLFLIRPLGYASGLKVLRLPISAAELDEKVTEMVELIQVQGSLDRITGISQELYRSLFAQAEPLLTGSKRLLLIPDGVLHKLPFAALVRHSTKGRPHYLVESWALHNVVSATVYAEVRKSKRLDSLREIVAFGDPVYPHVDSEKAEQIALSNLRSAVRASSRLPPLPHTRSEVESIAMLYPSKASVFLGDSATEEQARQHARRAHHLHFACHGLLDEDLPINSGLVLTVPIDPLEDQHDGVLQAWEIIEDVRLDADLVTLSACQTGLGKNVGGEGLVGLTRAFQYAGARSVLASLWSVSDESTADLMLSFYTHLRAGRPKDEALQAAQKEAIRSAHAATGSKLRGIGSVRRIAPHTAAHPFRWASFELWGDWR